MKMHVKRQFLYYHLFPVFEGILDILDPRTHHAFAVRYALNGIV